MSLAFPLLLLCGVIVLYFAVIRPRGAHMLKTYREAGGGWAGVKAVLVGFQSLWATVGAALAVALPDVATAASGIDFKELLPEPWGLYVTAALGLGLPVLRAFAATPTGQPPSGEA